MTHSLTHTVYHTQFITWELQSTSSMSCSAASYRTVGTAHQTRSYQVIQELKKYTYNPFGTCKFHLGLASSVWESMIVRCVEIVLEQSMNFSFDCQVCGKLFKSGSDLNIHSKSTQPRCTDRVSDTKTCEILVLWTGGLKIQ